MVWHQSNAFTSSAVEALQDLLKMIAELLDREIEHENSGWQYT